MNKVLMSLVFSSFIVTGACFAQTPTPAATPAADAAPTPATVKPAKPMHHSELHKAMRKLRGAKQDLEKAGHEYGGHKAKAIEAINEAISELQAAMDFEKK